jgi:hypothetical protein
MDRLEPLCDAVMRKGSAIKLKKVLDDKEEDTSSILSLTLY